VVEADDPRDVIGNFGVSVLLLEQVGVLSRVPGFEPLGAARRQNVHFVIVQAGVVEDAVVVALDDDALFPAVPDDVVVYEEVAGLVVAANPVAAPVERIVVVHPVVPDNRPRELEPSRLNQRSLASKT